ncbi:MAG: HAD-IA family hydrolase [Clostridia bacterium]|nr:HAD-IA family hydrolase [Clostridia bacterium]
MKRTDKKYKCLIFDADHTLLNYIEDEYAAFARVYEEIGMPIADCLLKDSRCFSEETWTEAGLYDVDEPRIQAVYHQVYRSHVTGIFEKVFQKYGNPTSVTAKEAGQRFLKALERGGAMLGRAKETLESLARFYDVKIATNGLADIQKSRLSAFEKSAKIYVSETVGCIKPLPAFFKRILTDTGYVASECLMIGDSLRSDVFGAKSVGMDGCWFNPERRENTTAIIPDYEISDIEQLHTFL